VEYEITDAVKRSLIETEKILAALKPPEKLADVVEPGDLAALVAPGRWEPLREIRQKREASLALVATIAGKISEIEEILRGLESRRPRDVSRLADQILAGEAVTPDPEPLAPVGLATLGREQLTAARAGLMQKKTEAESEAAWLARQAKIEEAKVLEEALTEAGNRYAKIVRNDLAPLHVLIDAGSQILSGAKSHPVLDTAGWRGLVFPSPPFLDPRGLLDGPYGSGVKLLAKFDSGAGISGVSEAWRRAVKAAVGVNSL
jgi:hypothetical protein